MIEFLALISLISQVNALVRPDGVVDSCLSFLSHFSHPGSAAGQSSLTDPTSLDNIGPPPSSRLELLERVRV
jgi:hypothetical protein